jgi:hypothetical protein
MDPTVIAAIITAIASLGTSFSERFVGGSRQVDEKIFQIVKEHYDELRQHLTDPCVQILKKAEDGQNHNLEVLREAVYPNQAFSSYQDERIFNSEFDYRLRYLQLVGVLAQVGGDYFITHTGMAFLRQAREKRDYFKILFG